jgi:hypothetical protein
MWNSPQDSNISYLVIGPSINPLLSNQLIEGEIQRCNPDYYTRNTLSLDFSGNSSDLPTADSTPYNNGTRFNTGYLSNFIDVATSNGNLNVLFGELYEIDYGPSRYLGKLSSTMEVCAGFVSWGYVAFDENIYLQEPQDVNCSSITIDIDNGDWNVSAIGQSLGGGFLLTGSIIQALVEEVDWGDPNYDHVTVGQELMNEISSVVLATYSSYVSQTISLYDISADRKAASCRDLQPQGPLSFGYVAIGLLHNYGTGMTILGIFLQVLALTAGLLALGLLFWSALPLLGEWSAQWVGLMDGVNRDMVREAIAGTSVGQGVVKSDLRVYLSSSREHDSGTVRLVLSTSKGEVERNCDHL